MKTSDFSMEGTHGSLGLFKYRKELHTRRERQNSRNWAAVEVVLGSILNASGSQKWRWCKYVRGLNAFGHRSDGEVDQCPASV